MKNELVIVLDRSGSMQAIREDMQGALDRILKETAKDDAADGQETCLTLTRFDTEIEQVCLRRPVAEAGGVQLQPRGATALYDAIGHTILACDEAFAADPPDKVMFMVITDGLENSSCEFSASRIKSLVEEREQKWNWAFTFIGADRNAVCEGELLGFRRDAAVRYRASREGVGNFDKALLPHMKRMRKDRAAKFSYTDEHRRMMQGEDESTTPEPSSKN